MIASLKNTKSILTWLIWIAYAGLFFSINVSTATIIALLLFCLINTPLKDFSRSIAENKTVQILLLMYGLLIIGLVYSENLKTGIFILEKKMTLLLIPVLALPLIQKTGVYSQRLLKGIGYITIATSIILLAIASYQSSVLNNSQAFHFETFTKPFVHYVYYAIFFAFGSLTLINTLLNSIDEKRSGILILTVLFVYALGFLILVASKMGIIAFGMASIALLYHKIGNKKIFAFVLIGLVAAASSILYFNDTTRNRFTELTEDISVITKDEYNGEVLTGLNLRLLFWKMAIVHSWQDRHTIAGVGTGDCQDYLNHLYSLPQYQLEAFSEFDSHNEWVFTFVQLGVIGVIAMGLLYANSLLIALRKNDMMFVCFLIITLLFSFSESILESNKGIVFCALLFTLLCAPYKREIKTI
ncbi:hypothetical protein BH09BAC3_BH09BAC3_21950 [soil metagenome]